MYVTTDACICTCTTLPSLHLPPMAPPHFQPPARPYAAAGLFDACILEPRSAHRRVMLHILDCRVLARGMSLNRVSLNRPKVPEHAAQRANRCAYMVRRDPHTFTRETSSLRGRSSRWGIPRLGDGALGELMGFRIQEKRCIVSLAQRADERVSCCALPTLALFAEVQKAFLYKGCLNPLCRRNKC